ncbi:ATP-binding protein [Cohnella suwonensis]|uniref:histidine kinase n=1 Tax=Cohnella suwonensis TaxID=696072 RepID=A0ABW0M185_9BACL
MRFFKRTWVILLLFAIAITAIRLPIYYIQKPIEQPHAKQGVLDLRGWTIPQDRTISLDGEWLFYPSLFPTPGTNGAAMIRPASERTFVRVPGAWDEAFPNGGNGGFRYGTYRMKILLDDHKDNTFRLRASEIGNASAIYVDGRLAAQAGSPSALPASHQARKIPLKATVHKHDGVIDILIPVSSHAGAGGIIKTIRFGNAPAVDKIEFLSAGQQLLLCVVLLIHGLYSLMLYGLGGANRGLLYFAMIIVCGIVSVLTVDDRLLLVWLPMPYELTVKLALLSYIGVASFIPPLLKQLFPDYGSAKAVRYFAFICTASAFFVLLCPASLTLSSLLYLIGFPLVLMIVLAFSILRPAVRKQEDVIYLLLSCFSLGNNIAWTVVGSRLISFEVMHYPFDLIFTVFAFAAFWFRRFFRSVERTQELTQRLQRANDRKDEFLVATSHELRNPLHGILNIAQNMMDDALLFGQEAQRRKLDVQIAVARRMSLMLDDLLDAAKLRDNKIRLDVENVHVQSAAAGAAEIVRFVFTDKPVPIVIRIDEDFPAVRADENRLMQILFNLIHNAMKFTEKGEVTVYAEKREKTALIHVRDTGIGIDDETKRRIFLPYEQGDAGTVAAYGGFGLGLSICKSLVELHGGELSVTSSPGQGAVFTLTLPLAEENGFPASRPASALLSHGETTAGSEKLIFGTRAKSEPAHRPSILAVDDDGLNLQILSEMLGGQYVVATARSGSEAIAKLDAAAFDLVILDVMMPGMSGYELARKIRERFSAFELPILLLTARARAEDIAVGFSAGASDYLTKPVDAMEIKARVRAWTELKRSVEERLRMEAAWLQAQIQPHFLFNTINSIAALGNMDTARMQALLEHFSNYLRMSFDFKNADRDVPIDRELALVRHYLYIEKERFGDRIEVKWELESGLHFRLPPMSIQTLVENAVNHGILRRASGGTITIRLSQYETSIAVSVSDNGVGMDAERQRQLFDPAYGLPQGIGLRNTDRRLKQLYGQGLSIRSAPGHGSIVGFRLPKS